MEPITLYLQPEATPKKQRLQRILISVFGVMYIITGIFRERGLGYIYLFAGAVAVIVALFLPHVFRPLSYTFDENGFAGPAGRPWNKRCEWSEITRLEAQMFAWTFITTSGKRVTINLGSLTFDQHKEIKPKILALASSKGIAVHTV